MHTYIHTCNKICKVLPYAESKSVVFSWDLKKAEESMERRSGLETDGTDTEKAKLKLTAGLKN